MAPAVRSQLDRVVVGHAGEAVGVGRNLVPLLAGDLARLAADADRGVGEEADAILGLVAVGIRPRRRFEIDQLSVCAHSEPTPARRQYSSTSSRSSWPRGRRPARMSQLAA